MLVHRTKKLIVRSTRVGSDTYFHKQTEKTLIRQLLRELTEPPLKNHKNIGFLCKTGPDPMKNHKARC